MSQGLVAMLRRLNLEAFIERFREEELFDLAILRSFGPEFESNMLELGLDESMVKWLGRGMPGFMHVQRKPTPKGLELHTLCCGICGIMLWFEVYEGKEAMAKKQFCDMMRQKLGRAGPWKSVALTLRMTQKWAGTGRVLIADSWFGSVPCILCLLYTSPSPRDQTHSHDFGTRHTRDMSSARFARRRV